MGEGRKTRWDRQDVRVIESNRAGELRIDKGGDEIERGG